MGQPPSAEAPLCPPITSPSVIKSSYEWGTKFDDCRESFQRQCSFFAQSGRSRTVWMRPPGMRQDRPDSSHTTLCASCASLGQRDHAGRRSRTTAPRRLRIHQHLTTTSASRAVPCDTTTPCSLFFRFVFCLVFRFVFHSVLYFIPCFVVDRGIDGKRASL